jgi:hypothetical protein
MTAQDDAHCKKTSHDPVELRQRVTSIHINAKCIANIILTSNPTEKRKITRPG